MEDRKGTNYSTFFWKERYRKMNIEKKIEGILIPLAVFDCQNKDSPSIQRAKQAILELIEEEKAKVREDDLNILANAIKNEIGED